MSNLLLSMSSTWRSQWSHAYPFRFVLSIYRPSSFGRRVRRSPLLTWQKKPILTVKNHVNIHEWSWNIMNINILHAFLQFQWFFFREEFFSGGPKTVWFLIFKTNNFLASGMCQVPSLKIHQNREQKFSSPFSPILYQFMNYNHGWSQRRFVIGSVRYGPKYVVRNRFGPKKKEFFEKYEPNRTISYRFGNHEPRVRTRTEPLSFVPKFRTKYSTK